MWPFVGVGLLFFRHFLNAPFERDWRSGGADTAYQHGETNTTRMAALPDTLLTVFQDK